MTVGVSLDQLLKRETVLGVLSRYHAPGNAFQNYYGLGITATGAQQIYGTTGQYDIFDGSRSLGYFSAPGAPPNRMPRKPIGSIPITVPRMYMSIDLLESQLYNIFDYNHPTLTLNTNNHSNPYSTSSSSPMTISYRTIMR